MRSSTTILYFFNNSKRLLFCNKSHDVIRNLSATRSNNMRFVQYKLKSGGLPRLGGQLTQEGDIIDISSVDHSIPNSLTKFLALGTDVYERARRFCCSLLSHISDGIGIQGLFKKAMPIESRNCAYWLRNPSYSRLMFRGSAGCVSCYYAIGRIIASGQSVVALKDVDLLPPIIKPDKLACVGLNYSGHCDEQNIPHPREPMFFSKFSSCIIGPYDNIQLPTISNCVDWEVELAVVIGRKAKAIRQDQVNDYIFGYTVAQDISARDWQKNRNNGQFLLGKSMDTFCPLGPAVVTKNKVDPNNLNIKSWVNGKLKQDGNTSEMIFKVDFLVSYLSQIITLYPGDVILTGTPAGVGMHRNPPEYLHKGDILESEIEGVGRLRNVVV